MATKRTTKQSAAKSTRARKTATKKAPAKQAPVAQEKPKRSPRWSVGCFRNAKGKLVTVYVNAAGDPMPYEMRRVGDAKILFHGVYADMKYSEARQQLLKDAAKAGVKEGAAPVAKPAAKRSRKPTAKKAKADPGDVGILAEGRRRKPPVMRKHGPKPVHSTFCKEKHR